MSITKPSSVEKYDRTKCVENAGGQFQLVLAASARAREIANKRNFAERGGSREVYDAKPCVQALIEISEGTIE